MTAIRRLETLDGLRWQRHPASRCHAPNAVSRPVTPRRTDYRAGLAATKPQAPRPELSETGTIGRGLAATKPPSRPRQRVGGRRERTTKSFGISEAPDPGSVSLGSARA